MKYYLELGIEKGDLDCACVLANFYEKKNNYKKMVFYYDLARDDNMFACFKLIHYYESNDNEDDAEIYYDILHKKYNIKK